MKTLEPSTATPKIVHGPTPAMPPGTACIGRLARSLNGTVLVEHDNRGPRPARHVAGLSAEELIARESVGREVLLLFEEGNLDRPIVLAWMAAPGGDSVSIDTRLPEPEAEREARVDGKRVVIEARQEILLRCGKGYILIREDGRIVIKGTDLLSRSSGINKIKGGAVRIN
jgi:hypothetical protein